MKTKTFILAVLSLWSIQAFGQGHQIYDVEALFADWKSLLGYKYHRGFSVFLNDYHTERTKITENGPFDSSCHAIHGSAQYTPVSLASVGGGLEFEEEQAYMLINGKPRLFVRTPEVIPEGKYLLQVPFGGISGYGVSGKSGALAGPWTGSTSVGYAESQVTYFSEALPIGFNNVEEKVTPPSAFEYEVAPPATSFGIVGVPLYFKTPIQMKPRSAEEFSRSEGYAIFMEMGYVFARAKAIGALEILSPALSGANCGFSINLREGAKITNKFRRKGAVAPGGLDSDAGIVVTIRDSSGGILDTYATSVSPSDVGIYFDGGYSYSGPADVELVSNAFLRRVVAAQITNGEVILSSEPLLNQGDINKDGSVDLLDYFVLSDYYGFTSDDDAFWGLGSSMSSNSQPFISMGAFSDINQDETVDLLDYFILADNFGSVED